MRKWRPEDAASGGSSGCCPVVKAWGATVTRALVVASLITTVGANHLDGRSDRVVAMSLALDAMLLVVWVWFWCSYWLRWQLLGRTAVGVGVVVTPPLESARGLCRSARASVTPSRSCRGVQPDEGSWKQPCETSFAPGCGDEAQWQGSWSKT